MAAKKKRRQSHGSAWHWKQTDCWYYTLPGSKRRMPLFDDKGQRIRGKHRREDARLALARIRLAGNDQPEEPAQPDQPWLVARVCSEYLQYCERGAANGTVSAGHRDGVRWVLNDLCRYCGAVLVEQLQKGHIEDWVRSHRGWKSPATQRMALTIVQTAFNYAADNFDVA